MSMFPPGHLLSVTDQKWHAPDVMSHVGAEECCHPIDNYPERLRLYREGQLPECAAVSLSYAAELMQETNRR